MKAKGKFFIFATFWLIVSTLTMFAFAGIISPESSTGQGSSVQLPAPVVSPPGKELLLNLEIEEVREPLYASLSLDSGNRHAIIAAMNLPGTLENIHIDEKRQLAFLANSFSGLQIINISDPRNMELIGAIETPGNAWDITTRGDILFLADARGGLQIYDVSSPESPTIISELTLPETPLLKLAIHKNAVYASSGKKGLQIIDISSLERPQFIKSLHQSEGTWGLMTEDSRLYLSSGRARLSIYDLKAPLHPELISQLDMPDRSWNIALQDHHLFLPTRKAGLQIIDIRREDRPVRLETTFEQHSVEAISIDGDMALLSNREQELYAYNISDPANPAEQIAADFSFQPRNLTYKNGIAYVASGWTGLKVLDVARISPKKLVETLPVPGILEQFLVRDDYYFLATAKHGLFIARQMDSRQLPTIVASVPVPGSIQNMTRIGNHLYLACADEGLQVVDISLPEKPKLIPPPNFPGNFNDIVVKENHIFAATAEGDVLVINATYPESLLLVGRLNLPTLRRLAIKNKRLYGFSQESGLHIIDISTPKTPTELGRCPLPWPLQTFAKGHQLIVNGDSAFLAAGEASLVHFDISNDYRPQILEIVGIDGETLTVATDGHSVFASTRQGKLWIFEIADGRLSRRSVSDILGNCNNIRIDADGLVLANGLKGLSYLPYPKQIAVVTPTQKSARTRNSAHLSLQIPPLQKPAIYNLTLAGNEKVIEFIGAVTITD